MVLVQNWTSKALLLFILSILGLNGQTLTLKSGWNLKGANETVGKVSFDQTCVDIVWKYNIENGWSAYSNKADISAKISNSQYPIIGSMDSGDGFWIKTNQACNITTTTASTSVTSDLVSPGLPNETTQPQKDTSILSQGWNLKGTSTVLDSSTFNKECIEVLWKYDTDNSWSGYSNNQVISNTITNKFTTINTEEGFWVKTTADCTLDPETTSSTTTEKTSDNNTVTTSGETVVDVNDYNSNKTIEDKKSEEILIVECMDQRVLDDDLYIKYQYKRDKNLKDYNICVAIIRKEDSLNNSAEDNSANTDTTTTTENTDTITTTEDTTPQFTEYTINTGFIKNPIIWQDTNANLTKDPGEPVGIKVTDTSYKISVVDSTKNILLKGGTDSRDNQPFNSIMMTKVGLVDENDNNNISVATSFFVVLKESGTITTDEAIKTKVNQMVGDDYTKDPTASPAINKFEIKLYKAIESILPSERSEDDIKKVYDDVSITSSTQNINNTISEYFGDGSDMIQTFLYDLMLLIDEQTLDEAGYNTINTKVVENIALHTKYPKVITTKTLQGQVMGGYLVNTTVFQDLNKNSIKDQYEPFVLSNANGVYSNLTIFDNTLDIAILSIGGTDKTYKDTSGEKDFYGVLSTLPDIVFTNTDTMVYNYITPLTNLVVLSKQINDSSLDDAKSDVFKLIDDTNYRVPSNTTELLKDPILQGDDNNKLFNINMSIFKDTESVTFDKEQYISYSKKLVDTKNLYENFDEVMFKNFSTKLPDDSNSDLSNNSKQKLFDMNNAIHQKEQPTTVGNDEWMDSINTLVYEIKNDIQTITNNDTGSEEVVEIVEPEEFASLTQCEDKLNDLLWKSLKVSTNSFEKDDSLPIWFRSLRSVYNSDGMPINSDITIIYENLTSSTISDDDRVFAEDSIYEVKYTPLHELRMFYIYYDDTVDNANDICKKVQFPAIDVWVDPFKFTTTESTPEVPTEN